jgi:hypothetical protein
MSYEGSATRLVRAGGWGKVVEEVFLHGGDGGGWEGLFAGGSGDDGD